MSVCVAGCLAPIGGVFANYGAWLGSSSCSCDSALAERASCGDGEHGTPNVIRKTRGCAVPEDVQRDSRRP